MRTQIKAHCSLGNGKEKNGRNVATRFDRACALWSLHTKQQARSRALPSLVRQCSKFLSTQAHSVWLKRQPTSSDQLLEILFGAQWHGFWENILLHFYKFLTLTLGFHGVLGPLGHSFFDVDLTGREPVWRNGGSDAVPRLAQSCRAILSTFFLFQIPPRTAYVSANYVSLKK